MENKEINADWARKTAQSQIGLAVQKQIETANENIIVAVKANKMFCYVHCTLDNLAQKDLISRGFKLNLTDADQRDQRDTSYWTISW